MRNVLNLTFGKFAEGQESLGAVSGRSTTDSQGTVTTPDARGKVISREYTSGNVTTFYGSGGRNVG